MAINLDGFTMTELVQLQTQISDTLRRRFERKLALLSSDVVGSTAYFARYGDVAGRGLQQLHLDLLQQSLTKYTGAVVDVAGDGAFSVLPSADLAVQAVVELEQAIAKANEGRAREHELQIRVGLHYGPVLTDDKVVSGDAVKLCSNVAGTGKGAEVRLTRALFAELSKEHRLRCRGVAPMPMPGQAEPLELLQLEWRSAESVPTKARVRETGEEMPLPQRDTITFGRLREQNGIPANDIVLALPDKAQTQQISRWQFEVRRVSGGLVLRSVTDQITEVDGKQVRKGEQVPLPMGAVVKVAKVAQVDSVIIIILVMIIPINLCLQLHHLMLVTYLSILVHHIPKQ